MWLPLLFACASCFAIDLRTAAQLGTEPKFMNAERGDGIVGLCTDIMRAVERVDPGLKFVGDQNWMPLIRIMTELEAGAQDATCALQHTRERDQKFTYLEPVLYPVEYVLLARIDDPLVVGSWDDVRHLNPAPVILANRGFGASLILDNLGGLLVDSSTTDTQLNLEKLIAGRARLYFHRGPGMRRILERAGVIKKVRILPMVMHRADFYFVVGRHLPQATAERLQRALLLLEHRGELRALYKKWD
ncbi:MAG: transporter substrate-binding domain-containing protein [Pseudomonadota bacterium]